MRSIGLALAFSAFCLTASASCGGTGTAAGATTEFDSALAWKHLEAMVAIGPRPAGSQGAEKTRAYIEERMREYGLEPVRESFTSQTPLGPVFFSNVVVTVPARESAGEAPPIVVLCTHYETKHFDFEFVGANDGASGTAVLIELARILAVRDNAVQYRLVFLDGEEAMRTEWRDPDNRYGSRHHVTELTRTGLLERIKACVLLDLVGDKKLRLTDDVYSDTRLKQVFYDAAREAGLGKHVNGRREAVQDDHLSFLEAGIPSVDLIDLDYEHWHRPGDTLEAVSAESLGVIGRIVLLGLPALEQLKLGS